MTFSQSSTPSRAPLLNGLPSSIHRPQHSGWLWHLDYFVTIKEAMTSGGREMGSIQSCPSSPSRHLTRKDEERRGCFTYVVATEAEAMSSNPSILADRADLPCVRNRRSRNAIEEAMSQG